ncbi:transglutaminase [Methylosinus sporium]|uniref:Transglutaminase n=1 Tax=Methylosinus sporium TaxID=428 RepID=A0A549STT5_METSR|nr:transglutaminase-like cysteine peptidase [Methylosinus sp. KRF6]TRL33071.1 transglutaminase [Methylosinus sporium]
MARRPTSSPGGPGVGVADFLARVSLRVSLALVLFGGSAAKAEFHGSVAGPEIPRASFVVTGEPTSIPYGWMDFCGRQPQECRQSILPAADIELSREAWARLNEINRAVNAAIEPLSNLEHWGTIADHWDYPVDGKGDCKIYALEKRRLLMEMGFPRQALLMTIVRDKNDQGHAILTARTSRGDFILDNLTDEVKPWDATVYRFVKRQSQEDPNVWVTIEPRRRVGAR